MYDIVSKLHTISLVTNELLNGNYFFIIPFIVIFGFVIINEIIKFIKKNSDDNNK